MYKMKSWKNIQMNFKHKQGRLMKITCIKLNLNIIKHQDIFCSILHIVFTLITYISNKQDWDHNSNPLIINQS